MTGNQNEEMIPFMDTFYTLSSHDPKERNVSASSLLHHIFLSSNDVKENDDEEAKKRLDALVKDGCYALTRLINGLCSGRASARQGYASCLSSFLKLSFQLVPSFAMGDGKKCWMDHFMEHNTENIEGDTMTKSEYVKKTLLDQTKLAECTKDKNGVPHNAKKGSEERDYMFGKLFGILSVVRSGTLSLDESDSSFEIVKDYLLELMNLNGLKKWLREPTAHAIKEMMNFLFKGSSEMATKLFNDSEIRTFFVLKNVLTAEKIALYLHLQCKFSKISTVPECLRKPILTVTSLKNDDRGIKTLLRDTSVVVHPRCHMVWESVWEYLCEEASSGRKSKKSKKMQLRKSCPVGDDSPCDVLESIVNNVIVQSLLSQSDANSVTHERKALAMSLISQLCQFQLPHEIVGKSILQPTIITSLFVKTLQKGGDKGKSNTLQPLALEIVNNIVKSLCSGSNNAEVRLAAIKSFLLAHSSFDGITNTKTVSSLLSLNIATNNVSEGESNDSNKILWTKYLSFLQNEMFEKIVGDDGANEAIKYVNLMADFTMKLIRSADIEEEVRQNLFRHTSLVFAVCAFFDIKKLKVSSASKNGGQIMDIAKDTYAKLKQKKAFIAIPHDLRVWMSSRFFTLVSDYIHTDKRGKLKGTKISLIIGEVSYFQNSISNLEAVGAKVIHSGAPIDDEDSKHLNLLPFESSIKICSDVRQLIAQESDERKSQGLSAILALILSLGLQLLHPGQPDNSGRHFEEDELDEHFDEIIDTSSDLFEIAVLFKNKSNSEDDGNVLSALAATCVNLFNTVLAGSTSTVSEHLGGASRLIRECVQLSWSTFLTAHADNESNVISNLDEEVIILLLESICSPEVFSDQMDDDADETDIQDEDMEDASDTDDSSDEDMGAFTKATKSGIDVDNMEIDQDNNSEEGGKEIELDPSALENLLLEDMDAIGSDDEDEAILEHHEGADGALAQMIKLKLEARKAGQSKREKAELSNQLRCLPLLDTIFTSSKRYVLPTKITLMVILPLLRTKTILHKALIAAENSVSSKKGSSVPEKRVLMQKIIEFLMKKVCKMQFRDEKSSLDACQLLATQIMSESNLVADAEHSELCSSLLAVVVKAVGGNEDMDVSKTLVQSIYGRAATEWSQNKKSKLNISIFEKLMGKCPMVAKCVLPMELIKCSKDGRSAYIKCESFRLLSSLFNIKDDESEVVKTVLKEAVPHLCESLSNAFDNKVFNTQRAREVLKTVETLVQFLNKNGNVSLWESANKLRGPLEKLKDSDSPVVQSQYLKLDKSIKEGVENVNTKEKESAASAPAMTKSKGKKKKKGKKKGKK